MCLFILTAAGEICILRAPKLAPVPKPSLLTGPQDDGIAQWPVGALCEGSMRTELRSELYARELYATLQCAQRRLRSAWASAQSNQSLRCALKTAVTLTKPTVGRRSVGLIGRQSGDSRPILCPILAGFLVGRLKENYNQPVTFFFRSPDDVWVLVIGSASGDRLPTIGRRSADFICE